MPVGGYNTNVMGANSKLFIMIGVLIIEISIYRW